VVQPYPYQGVADGIAFSCSNTGKVEGSLRYMFKEIDNTVCPEGHTWDPDLKRWSNQGMLILNSAFTTTIGKVGQHYAIWQPFMAFLLDFLMYNNPGLVYVFMGKKAQEWAESVPDNNYKVTCTHPAFAAHNNYENWDSQDMFRKVQDTVQKSYNYKIIW